MNGTDLDTEFGSVARSLRRERGLTLSTVADAARAAGHVLDYSTLGKLERGEARWSSRRFAAVAAGLGVDVAALLEVQGSEPTEGNGPPVEAHAS